MSSGGATFIMICVIALALVLTFMRESNKQKYSMEDSPLNDLYSSYSNGVLEITKRDESFESKIKIIPHTKSTVSYKPESYVYTGATVGGITTGGVHKEGGYNYISSSRKTEKCDMYYRNVGRNITKIKLTSQLAEEARKSDKIKNYVSQDDYILLENKVEMSSVEREAFLKYAKIDSPIAYNLASDSAYKRAPSREKCEAILEWICGK